MGNAGLIYTARRLGTVSSDKVYDITVEQYPRITLKKSSELKVVKIINQMTNLVSELIILILIGLCAFCSLAI